jgi:hypothetical protein
MNIVNVARAKNDGIALNSDDLATGFYEVAVSTSKHYAVGDVLFVDTSKEDGLSVNLSQQSHNKRRLTSKNTAKVRVHADPVTSFSLTDD